MGGRAVVVPLDLTDPPTVVLRRLRGEPGLVALVGDWCGGGALLGCRPTDVLPADADPFDVPDVWATDVDGPATVGGGWVALWGYPLAHRVERLPDPPPRPHPQPAHWVARYDWFLRYDGRSWAFESLLEPGPAASALDAVRRVLADGDPAPRPYTFSPFAMTPGPGPYRDAVAATVEHIRAGDVFQVNVCTRFEAGLDGDPLDVFCAGVEALSPSHAAFVDAGGRQVVSLSPELFLRRVGREVETRPIKGHRARQDAQPTPPAARGLGEGPGRERDDRRPDAQRPRPGRATGTVRVPALAAPERSAGVRHLVSEVRGTLRRPGRRRRAAGRARSRPARSPARPRSARWR